jgi:tripartite-type tricarboxylate transporter receptor subunit TctC
MTQSRRRFLHMATGAVTLAAMSPEAWAQAYPVRPITMIIPYPPGGSTDVVARNLSDSMRATLGQSIVIENVGGANGSIGVGRAARAAPDGYTLVMGNWNTFVGNGAIYALSYNLVDDFKPVALVSAAPALITTRKELPAKDVQQLIAWLKQNPDKATEGHPGIGSGGHVIGIFFQRNTDTRFRLVPYRGGGPAVQDLVAGHIDIVMNSASDTLAQVRAGTVNALAVMAARRLTALPDVPTVDEGGLPGFYFSQWFGLWAPKGTPDDIIGKINAAVMAALADRAVRARLADVGQEIFPPDQQSVQALGAWHHAEIAKWWPIIREANIRAE